jgi:uncharacterized protein with GYD domain
MPIFISQGRYTRDAVTGMIAKPEDRGEATAAALQAAGGRLIAHYLTFGAHDFLVICEVPSEKDMAAMLLAIAAGGGVSDLTTTLAMTSVDAKAAFGKAGAYAKNFKSAGKG